MATERARSHRINIRISESLNEKVEYWADRLGMAPATISSIALAEWIDSKHRQMELVTLSANRLAETQHRLFSDPEFLNSVFSMIDDTHGGDCSLRTTDERTARKE